MDVILVGHSFVRRFRDAKIRRQRNPTDRDINVHQKSRAASMAASMRLSRHINGVYTISESIIYFHHVLQLRDVILSVSPRAIVVDIGSNDLARITTVNPRRILQLAAELHTFVLNLDFMSDFCDTSPHLVFNKQRGLQYTTTNQPRPVNTWSHDGIHLSPAGTAFTSYESRIRHSLLDNIFH